MRRADIILITKSPEDLSAIQRRLLVKEVNKATYQNLYFTSLSYEKPVPLFKNDDGKQILQDISGCSGCGIILVTGIANPLPLKNYLMQFSEELIHMSFPDHHAFRESDITDICSAFNKLRSPSKYILTTEKDAVRLREFVNIAEPFRSAFYYIPVGIIFLNDDKDEFDNLIVDYVRKNKKNNRISEGQRNY